MEVSGRRNSNQDEASEAIDEKLCHPCKEDGALQQAYGYCNDCKEDLCETCYKYHRRPKPFKDHTLLKHDIEENEEQDSREETDTNPPPLPERKYLKTNCRIHDKEELKYHCRSHDIIICIVCALKQHKVCKKVDYIPDVFETENKRVVEIIEYVEGKIEYKLKQEMDVVQVAEKSFESSTSAMKAQKGEIDRYFEEKEKCFINKITTFRDESKGRQKEIMDLAHKLKKDKSRVTPISADSDVNKYTALQEIKTNVKNINQKLPGVFANPTLTMSYKQHHPLPPLGEAVVVEQQGNISKKEMKLLRKVDVKGEKKSCSLVDATLVSKGRVVFTDNRNDRLIIISDDYEPVFHECSGKPWGLSCITNTEIVVSFPYEKDLKFYHVNDEVSCSGRSSIKMSQRPCGISYLKPESELIIAVLRQDDTRIESWSLDGQLLRIVVLLKYDYGRLTLTVDQKILCSSSDLHIVRLLELDGTAIKAFEYVDENIRGPFGIASDANGNIYICGFKCLRVVSKDRIWDEIISPENGYAPQALEICHEGKRLYVGQGNGPLYTEVLIYQM